MERFTTYDPSHMRQADNTVFTPVLDGHPPQSLRAPLKTLKNKQHSIPLFDAAEEWRIAFESVSTPIFVHDKNFRVIRANKAYAKLAKMEMDELIGQYYWKVFPKRNGPFACCRNEHKYLDKGVEELFSQPGMVYKTQSYVVPHSQLEDPHIVHILEDVTVELERRRRIHFLESMDKVNRAFQTNGQLEDIIHEVLQTLIDIFDCDRAFLVTPCDPESAFWSCPMEVSRKEYPGARNIHGPIPMNAAIAEKMRILLKHPERAIRLDPKSDYPLPSFLREHHQVQSMLAMSVFPNKNTAWEFGIIQCSRARVWIEDEVTLFQEIGQRFKSALGTLLVYNDLQTALRVVENSSSILFRWSAEQGWPVEYVSHNLLNILGYQPEELLSGHRSYAGLIHEEDLADLEQLVKEYKQAQHDNMEFEYRVYNKANEIRWVKENTHAVRDKDNTISYYEGIVTDITEQKQVDLKLQQLNRTLRALSAGSEHLIHASDEKMLLRDMCQTIVEIGGYTMAWVGYAQNNPAKTIRPIAQFGNGNDYLNNVSMSWGHNELGNGPTGKAVRTGKTHIIRNTQTDPSFEPWRKHALEKGYASVVSIPLYDKNRVFGAITIDAERINAFDEEEIKLLEELAHELAYGILHLRLDKSQRLSTQQLHDSLVETIKAIAITVEKRDPYTAGHQNRTADICAAIGRELGLSNDQIEGLRLGAMIHDIGKIYVPAEVLNRPGKLTAPEFEMIKSHAAIGYDIVKDITFPWPIAEMVLQHHERLDGSGYPNGLKGDEINFNAKILAVADIVEAMSAHRPYRPSLGVNRALEQIKKLRGTQLEAIVVDACLHIFEQNKLDLEAKF